MRGFQMKSKRMIQTTSLFAKPSFASGMARAVDLGRKFTSYNTNKSEGAADHKALRADWRAVGKDLEEAVSLLEVEWQTNSARR